MSRKPLDLTGERFGRLVALRYSGLRNQKRLWLCRCDCGNQKEVRVEKLRSGATKSCGCLQVEASHRPKRVKHGKYQTAEYQTWISMRKRCRYNGNASYKRYGGRGIGVCDRWLNSFENFYADMGDKPSPEYSLDRVDNDRDYSPENCKWSTPVEQGRNRANTRFATYLGVTRPVMEWADIFGMDRDRMYSRVVDQGLSVGEAVTKVCRKSKYGDVLCVFV